MVKLTIVGRVIDGLPLAQGPMYVNEVYENLSIYKQQGEFLLKEISRGALPISKMSILVDHHCFNYMVQNGVCFMTLCDLSYPKKLAFHYLNDLHEEFNKFDKRLVERITTAYSFIKFDGIIGNIRRKYVDTRTQENLSKLNASHSQVDFVSESFSQIVKQRRRSEMLERMQEAHLSYSPIWQSKRLEHIAMKWTPIAIGFTVVSTVLIWTCLLHKEDFLFTHE